MLNQTYILSLGGSLIVPREGIDVKFLKKFRSLILAEIKKGKKFIIITGGGTTARDYISAANQAIKIKDDDKDWLGIHSTRLNAHLLRTIFFDTAHPEIITNPDKPFQTKNAKIIVASGWRPGWSTDYVATVLAKKYKIKTIINLSNIDYAYDKDPKIFPDAKIIEKINWPEFRKIVGDKWTPGLNMPFDPIASKLAAKLKLEVVIMNGADLTNVKKYIDGKNFKGTEIC